MYLIAILARSTTDAITAESKYNNSVLLHQSYASYPSSRFRRKSQPSGNVISGRVLLW